MKRRTEKKQHTRRILALRRRAKRAKDKGVQSRMKIYAWARIWVNGVEFIEEPLAVIRGNVLSKGGVLFTTVV